MTMPLYQGHDAPGKRPVGGHAGLWFQRFFDRFESDWTVKDSGKREWLRTLQGGCGDHEALTRAGRRLLALAQARGGEGRAFVTDWRFATGLGLEHPVENGFAWHPTLGTPYLCGAAVKGLVRAWVECWEDFDDEERRQARLKDWFGDVDRAGALVFFDALPVSPPALTTDVMTPHMGKWYEQGGGIQRPEREPEKLPADWHDPVPVPFLVAREVRFLFAIAPRAPRFADRVEPAFQALENALAFLGAGAKTAVGYGSMSPDDKLLATVREAVQAQQAEQAKAAMSEEEQAVFQVGQRLEQDRAAGRKEAGGELINMTNQLLKQAEGWDHALRCRVADQAEDVFTYIGWGKKKKERKAKLAALRQP